MNFWKNIMESDLITDLFVAPRWKESEGVRTEYERCKEKKVLIHYPKKGRSSFGCV
jgi:hypothetical protein